MKVTHVTIEMISYWQVSSGLGRGKDVDSLALRDHDGLPFIPGRTLKGLFREAVTVMEEHGHVPDGTTDILFGKKPEQDDDHGSSPGCLRFTNALLPTPERQWLASKNGNDRIPHLFQILSSTRIDRDGIADDKTLRRIEVVIPVKLEADISGPDHEPAWIETIRKAGQLIRNLGSGRHRGFGRCSMEVK